MPKIIPREERKEHLTLRLRKEVIEELRKIKGYNQMVENLIEKYLINK